MARANGRTERDGSAKKELDFSLVPTATGAPKYIRAPLLNYLRLSHLLDIDDLEFSRFYITECIFAKVCSM